MECAARHPLPRAHRATPRSEAPRGHGRGLLPFISWSRGRAARPRPERLEDSRSFFEAPRRSAATWGAGFGIMTSASAAAATGNTSGQCAVEKAVIVGGGLGGLAAAVSLRRYGIDAQVYEKREAIGGGEGTLILVAPNGLYALSQICPAVVPQIIAAGNPSFTGVTLAPDGSVLQQGRFLGPIDKPKYGLPSVAIAWNDILNVLRAQLPPECLRLGHTFTGLTQTKDGVEVTFDKSDGGKETVQAPLVIASDGIRSAIRTSLFGIDAKSHVDDLGRTIWRAMVPFDSFNRPPVEKGHTYTMFGGDRICLLADAGSGRLYMAFTVMDSAMPGGVFQRCKSPEEAHAKLQGFFKGWPLAERALEIVEPAKLLERRVESTPVLTQWAKGDVILIGDSAHAVAPTLGQGANMAFEDAWELAEALKKYRSLSEALRKFEAIRIPRVQGIAGTNSAQAAAAYGKKEAGNIPMLSFDDIFGYTGSKELLSTAA